METTFALAALPDIFTVREEDTHFAYRTLSSYTDAEQQLGFAPTQDWQSIIDHPDELASLLRKRQLIAYGAFGVVYEVAGAAIKIGCIGESEPIIQQWVYEQYERALPVWAFRSDIPLPKVVTREVCPQHGFLSKLWTRSSVMCHCGEPLSALVMPVADLADQHNVDAEGISEKIYNAVFDKFELCLDIHRGNFLEFNGKLMVCDFGDPSDKAVDYW